MLTYEQGEFLKAIRTKTRRKKSSSTMTKEEFLLQKNKEIIWIKCFRTWLTMNGFQHNWLCDEFEIEKTEFSKFINGKYNKYESGINTTKWFIIKNKIDYLMDFKDKKRMLDDWKCGRLKDRLTIKMWMSYRNIDIPYLWNLLKHIDPECLVHLKFSTLKGFLNYTNNSPKVRKLLSPHIKTINDDIGRILKEIETDDLDVNVRNDLLKWQKA
jgi:hypothetical protein